MNGRWRRTRRRGEVKERRRGRGRGGEKEGRSEGGRRQGEEKEFVTPLSKQIGSLTLSLKCNFF